MDGRSILPILYAKNLQWQDTDAGSRSIGIGYYDANLAVVHGWGFRYKVVGSLLREALVVKRKNVGNHSSIILRRTSRSAMTCRKSILIFLLIFKNDLGIGMSL
jgi:hypothetical protein